MQFSSDFTQVDRPNEPEYKSQLLQEQGRAGGFNNRNLARMREQAVKNDEDCMEAFDGFKDPEELLKELSASWDTCDLKHAELTTSLIPNTQGAEDTSIIDKDQGAESDCVEPTDFADLTISGEGKSSFITTAIEFQKFMDKVQKRQQYGNMASPETSPDNGAVDPSETGQPEADEREAGLPEKSLSTSSSL